MLGISVCRSACKVLAQCPVPAACPTWSVAAPRLQSLHTGAPSLSADQAKDPKEFDLALLQFLVCPLSRKPLRYEESTNELINDELGIAYPVVDGIPNMIPQDARMIKQEKAEDPDHTS
ncbi:protein preY, mitochondrial [Discoglossus pictus]